MAQDRSIPAGSEALIAAQTIGGAAGTYLFIASDRAQAEMVVGALPFFHPGAEVIYFPAWDCVPYDRVSPSLYITQQRIHARWQLTQSCTRPRWIVVPIAALMQRVGPLPESWEIHGGENVNREALTEWLILQGYQRVDMVSAPGEFSVRGSLLDVFSSHATEPARLDWFGDVVESMHTFDVDSQRSREQLSQLLILPVTEVVITPEVQQRFLHRYRDVFAVDFNDPLYSAIQQGRRYQGVEHWLPLFYESLAPLWQDIPIDGVVVGEEVTAAMTAQWQQIQDHYTARQTLHKTTFALETPYYPVTPESFYIAPAEMEVALSKLNVQTLQQTSQVQIKPVVLPGNAQAILALEWLQQKLTQTPVLIGCATAGRQARAQHMMEEANLPVRSIANWAECQRLQKGLVAVVPVTVSTAWQYQGAINIVVVPDTLFFGAVEVNRHRTAKKPSIAINDLNPGDLVVHNEHGIGRYEGLVVLEVMDHPHDCLQVVYTGGDKLFVPVENIGVLTRYGSEMAELDKLGSTAWQNRKARVKNRITEIAHHLLRIAAERQTLQGTAIEPNADYTTFCQRFPYPETNDQHNAIADVLEDLASGKPMDRLVCGDVGFGKTEVAMRAAYVVASQGFQVAVVVPTTILCQQHYENFQERFQGTGIRIAALSRLVPTKEAERARAGLAKGDVQIIIATHGILSSKTQWQNLGLVIIDEEHHFGVAQKEKLKELRSTIHVLTLTATPIPRTLQMALTGVRDLSLITTAPMDRMPVRTHGLIKDPVVIRDAILRERFRGGQVFYVCPRIEDLPDLEAEIRELVPEIRVLIAHGQMPAVALEKAMHAFDTRQYDLLLCTNIIESGIDIPTANTMIIHRADLFGLAQLYQLRGRVGRGKVRGYAYFTTSAQAYSTPSVQKRLDVIQSLDYLGAGFALASHDMELRGAGNLVGKEQSGHIREVGMELYQKLLDEALEAVQTTGQAPAEMDWEVQVNVGMPVMIPEGYVSSLSLRLQLYRRIGAVKTKPEIDTLAAEIVDRFGPLPAEAENLLVIMELKVLCRQCGIQRLDAGPKGMVVTFSATAITDPMGLVNWIQRNPIARQMKPDNRLVVMEAWPETKSRIAGVKRVLQELIVVVGKNGSDH